MNAQLACRKFPHLDDGLGEKKTHRLNLHKQATSQILSLKKQTNSDAMSYNFSLNRDAMQSQGFTQMSLMKQRSMNLFERQSPKSSV